MKRIGRFIRISSREKRLLIQAACLLVLIRASLWLLPFNMLLQLLKKTSRASDPSSGVDEALIKEVAWAVRSTSRYVPFATCLTQAVTTKLLLRRLDQPSRLHIGVAKSQDGKFEAHAWVESQGRIVIGRLRNHSRFTALSQANKEIL